MTRFKAFSLLKNNGHKSWSQQWPDNQPKAH